jgi:hypothetical protein
LPLDCTSRNLLIIVMSAFRHTGQIEDTVIFAKDLEAEGPVLASPATDRFSGDESRQQVDDATMVVSPPPTAEAVSSPRASGRQVLPVG